jgi:hypothetical protein
MFLDRCGYLKSGAIWRHIARTAIALHSRDNFQRIQKKRASKLDTFSRSSNAQCNSHFKAHNLLVPAGASFSPKRRDRVKLIKLLRAQYIQELTTSQFRILQANLHGFWRFAAPNCLRIPRSRASGASGFALARLQVFAMHGALSAKRIIKKDH